MNLIASLKRFDSFRIGNDIVSLKSETVEEAVKEVKKQEVIVSSANTSEVKKEEVITNSYQEKPKRRLSLLERLFITEYA